MGSRFMEDYQNRVIEEQKELGSKLEKLLAFIKKGYRDDVPQDERDRLFRQAIHTREYNDVLKERIAAFAA